MIKDYEQLAADRGVRKQLFHRRINQGFTPEQAAEPVLVSALDMVTAREHGISRRTVYKRLKRGVEKREALTAPDTRKSNNNPYEALMEPAERFTKDETLFMIQQFRKYNIKLNKLLLRRAEEYQINLKEVT